MANCLNGWEFVQPPFVIKIDNTLTKNGYAANAATVGEIIKILTNQVQDKEDKEKIETELPELLVSDTSYFLGVLTTEITANFPLEANIGDIIQIMFQQGENAQNVRFTGPTIGISGETFDDANTNYEVMGMWNGTTWVCLFSKIGL